MERTIGRWCYWIGIAAMAVAIVWKVLAALGVVPKNTLNAYHPINYDSVMKGAFMMLAVTVATYSYKALTD